MKNQDQNHAETPLVTAARAHVLQLWNTQHDARLVFHNFAQAAAIAEQAGAISRAEGLPESDRELVQVAAWFHNVGYLYEPRQVAETSAIRAEFFMVEQKCVPEKIEQLRQTIMEAFAPNKTELETARVLHDAIRAYDWAETYDTRGPLLQLEQELLSGHAPDPAAWLEFVRKQLQEPFLTASAKQTYEPALAARQLELHQQLSAPGIPVAKKKKAEQAAPERFDRLARRPLRSSIQTYFRANYANHIRLSAIADNKAHIMISVNSILLSVAISLLTYQTFTNRNPLFILPIILFLVTSLSSLIYAVLSSKPRVTSFMPHPQQPASPVFFGSFIHLSLDQYEAAVDEMLRDGRLLFGNMARDLYFLGHVLDKKYKLLAYSYTIFMMGFVATVGAFLGAYFLG